jgi:outer membrane protein assembly factor BamA
VAVRILAHETRKALIHRLPRPSPGRNATARAALAALGVAIAAAGCVRGAGADLFPTFVDLAGSEIDEVGFHGQEPFDEDTLQTLIGSRATRCSLLGMPVCIGGLGRQRGYLDLEVLRDDVRRLSLFYRQNGFFGTTVRPQVETLAAEGSATDDDEDRPQVLVTFEIARTDAVIVERLGLEGLDGALDTALLRGRLPLAVGDTFRLPLFTASADTVLRQLRREGYAFSEILRNFGVDTLRDRADAELLAIPGPVVTIDTVIVVGGEHLGRGIVLRQVGVRSGDLLQMDRLAEGQRNLYNLELVRFASVAMAPDSLQASPGDSTRASVLVQVDEGDVHVVDAGAGFGSVSCGRVDATWVSRSFIGGARRLAIGGSVSKLGQGDPLAFDFGRTVCDEFSTDVLGNQLDFGNDLDYQLTADLTRPFFISPRNQLTLTGFVERVSEPQVFQRRARGGRFGIQRRFVSGDLGTIGVSVERASVQASDAIFCLTLSVCDPEVAAALQSPRWRNGFDVVWTRDRTDRPIDPRGGYQARASTTWAVGALGSDLTFVQVGLGAATYRQVKPDWVLAAQARISSFLGTATVSADSTVRAREDVLPPDERLFAGGANSVRGFGQNTLGPGVWIYQPEGAESGVGSDTIFVPVGGTTSAIATLELRFPSPFLSDRMRLAAFVDAGTVQVGGLDALGSGWRVTPGVGLRIRSPVGPIRMDLAFNPQAPPTGELFEIPEEGGPIPIGVLFQKEQTLLRRLQFHLAVGQAF